MFETNCLFLFRAQRKITYFGFTCTFGQISHLPIIALDGKQYKSTIDCYLNNIIDLPGRPGFSNFLDSGDILQWWHHVRTCLPIRCCQNPTSNPAGVTANISRESFGGKQTVLSGVPEGTVLGPLF